jgi:hypothetical protein
MLGVVGGVNVGEWVSGFEGETEVFPALSKLHYSLYGTCHTSPPPPTHHSILLWQHHSPHFDTHSLLLRE